MLNILDIITDWIKGILRDCIMGNLDGMFDQINSEVGEVAANVGTTPAAWNAGVFSMIRNLSDNVVVPIAGMIITFVLCYELISMLMEKNNFPAVPGVDVKIYLPKDPDKDHGKLMGFASVSLGGVFAVNNIRIYNTENGPYVSMPSTKGQDGKYHDICCPTTKEMRQALNAAVLSAYEKAVEKRQAVKFAAHSAAGKADRPRLQFEEPPSAADSAPTPAPKEDAPPTSRNYQKAVRRVERAEGQVEQAREHLPTKRRLSFQPEVEVETGRTRRRLHFEQEVLPEYRPPSLPARAGGMAKTAAVMKLHGKIHESERQNVGVEATHKSELFMEQGVGRALRWQRNRRRSKPYRALRQAEQRVAKENVKLAGSGKWQTWTVGKILADEVYTGDMVQGKHTNVGHKQVLTKPEDWIVVRNTHEPLVSREVFAKAQAVREQMAAKYTRTMKNPYSENILRGRVFCAYCGKNLHRQRSHGRYFYRCISNDRMGEGSCTGGIIHLPDGGYMQEQATITAENGTQYFVMGKNRIKITEHFPSDGRPIEELITDLIIHKIKEKR